MITDLLLLVQVAIPALVELLGGLGLGAAGYSLWKGSRANKLHSMQEILNDAIAEEGAKTGVGALSNAAAKLNALDEAREIYGGEHLYNPTNQAQGYGNIDINSDITNAYIKQLGKKEALDKVLKFNVSDYMNNEEFNSTPILSLSESYTTPRILTWKELITNPAEGEILETELTPVIEEFPSTPLDYVNGIRSLSSRKGNRNSKPDTLKDLEVGSESVHTDITPIVITDIPPVPPDDKDPKEKEGSPKEEPQAEANSNNQNLSGEERKELENLRKYKSENEAEKIAKSIKENAKKIGRGVKDVGIGTWHIIKNPRFFIPTSIIGTGIVTEEAIRRNNNKQKKLIEELQNSLDSIRAWKDSTIVNGESTEELSESTPADTTSENNDTIVKLPNGIEITLNKDSLQKSTKFINELYNKK